MSVAVTQSTSTAGTFTYTLVSAVDALGCSATSSGSAVITIDTQPVANAGPDQTLCNTSTFTMAAVPSVGTGMWTTTNSSITITTPSSATTTVTGLAAGTSATLTWTETNGTCSDMNTVDIQNDQQPVANAGPDQTLCNTSTFTMAAVPSVGTGMWTTTNSSITITTPSSATIL